MMRKMRRNYIHFTVGLLFFCCSVNGIAQNTTISYELIYKPNPTQKDKTKKQNYKLDILDGKSIFRTEMRRSSDSLIKKTGFGTGYNTNPNYEFYFVKDIYNNVFEKHF